MAKRIAVVISEDPHVSGRPVEALRIALGLCAGDHETTVVLLGRSSSLLLEDTDDIVDVDVLEKYLPSFTHLAVPFVVESGTPVKVWPHGFSVTTRTSDEIRQLIRSVDSSLIF